ncbi:MAG: DOMON domain-containing protein [Planctomycetota bacterium]
MKTLKLLAAVVLALTALLGLILTLQSQTVVARLADSGAPISAQALPAPYLNSPEVVDAPFDNPPSPTVDGLIAPGEYAGAGKVTFPGHGGDVEVFFKEDGTFLYVAFDVPLFDLSSGSTYVDVYLDTDHDHTMDQTDYQLRVRDDGVTREYTPTAGLWGGEKSAVNWTAAMTTALAGGGWQVEYRIAYTKLGVAAGTYKELGLALGTVNGGSYYWPPDAYATGLHLWGSLVSSSDWGTFYWKPGPWEDYAPSGMPDFDQRQASWFFPTAAISTHCGPVAMANSLWWFDSKFETLTGTMPPVVSARPMPEATIMSQQTSSHSWTTWRTDTLTPMTSGAEARGRARA